MYNGPIIDAHQHFWEPDKNPHPWLQKEVLIPFRYGDYSAIKRRYLPDDYLRDCAEHQVIGSVYIDAEWDPADPLGETRYIHQVARHYGYPNGMVAQAWLNHPDCDALLKAQAAWPLVRSVRHKPGGALTPDAARQGVRSLMSDNQWLAGYARLGDYGLHFDLQTPWWHLDEAARLARDFPATHIILNHTGLPSDRSPAGLQGWHRAMSLLADLPNVAVKISGLGQPGIAWTLDNNRWLIRETLAIFGHQRCMFASNFPVDSLCVTLSALWCGFKQSVSGLPAADQQALFCDNARRIYRLALPITATVQEHTL